MRNSDHILPRPPFSAPHPHPVLLDFLSNLPNKHLGAWVRDTFLIMMMVLPLLLLTVALVGSAAAGQRYTCEHGTRADKVRVQ